VFDSGVGGLSVLKALVAELPHEDFVYVADSGYAPYGERTADFVAERAGLITRHLCLPEAGPIKALVIACNTATAAAIHLLRQAHPELPIIGVEPALKPAVASSLTRRIGVMATRGTLDSRKFSSLLEKLAGQASFVCQPCDGLADAIERGDNAQISALITRYTQAMGHFGQQANQIDTLVLGCTHYPFARQQLQARLPPGVQLIDNGEPVARQTRRMLTQLAPAGEPGHVSLWSTGEPARLAEAAQRWLGLSAAVQSLKLASNTASYPG
jgi:glutamate racemase